MSRLDSMLRRLSAQDACLRYCAGLIEKCSGPVLELGLGHGRTYDHLRHLFPNREVYVFERHVASEAANLVPADRLFLGDLRETLVAAHGRIGEKAALAHCDLGSGRSDSDRAFARWLGSAIPIVVAPQGIVVSDQLLRGDSLQEIALPPNVPPDRYHLYEVRPV